MKSPKQRHAPAKKRRADLEKELLDVVLPQEDYRSSEDEDYAPDGPSARSRPGPRRAGKRARSAAAKASPFCTALPAVEEEEETTPLAQRRRQLRQQAQQGQAAPPTASPTAHLPTDIIARVLQFAAAHNALPTVATAACVCRTWRAAVQQTPHLWRSLDLSHPRYRHTDAVIQREAAGRWQELAYLSLSGCNKLGDASLKALAQHCPKLSHLDLSYTTRFSEAGLTSALSAMLLRRASDGASPLRCLNLSCIQVTPRASGIDQLLRQVLTLQAKNEDGPVLEELQMEGVPLLTHQGLRAICDASFEQRRPLLGALRLLSLTQSAGARSNFSINIERLQYACPKLEELRLNGLGGSWGWEFNQGAPAAFPDYLPAARTAGTAADVGYTASSPAGAAGSAARSAAGATSAAATVQEGQSPPPQQPQQQHAAEGGEAATSAVGFPCLRVAELGSIVLHAEGSLFGRSHLSGGALERLLGSSSKLEELDLRGTRVGPDSLLLALRSSAPLRRLALARSAACCDACVAAVVERHSSTLEDVDVSWGAHDITDASAQALAPCPRLSSLNLAGTAISEEGVRAVVAAAKQRGALGGLQMDISSCRGVGRGVRQAGSQGVQQLAAALGLL